MGRNHGYVFYEGDAFIISANPFIDPNAEYEGWQQTKQKPLKVNFKHHDKAPFINDITHLGGGKSSKEGDITP